MVLLMIVIVVVAEYKEHDFADRPLFLGILARRILFIGILLGIKLGNSA